MCKVYMSTNISFLNDCLETFLRIIGLGVVMGPGQNFLTQVGSIFVTRVRLGQPSIVLVLVWKISPKNITFFNFQSSGQKKYLPVGSKSPRDERWVGLLFTAGQK